MRETGSRKTAILWGQKSPDIKGDTKTRSVTLLSRRALRQRPRHLGDLGGRALMWGCRRASGRVGKRGRSRR